MSLLSLGVYFVEFLVMIFLTKQIYSQAEGRELLYLVGMFSPPSPGDSISGVVRNLLQGGRRGSQAVYKFATKGVGSLNIKDQVPR